MQQILEMLKAIQKEADTDRIADRGYTKQMMDNMESWGEKIQAET
jgi:hypothetical protein